MKCVKKQENDHQHDSSQVFSTLGKVESSLDHHARDTDPRMHSHLNELL